MPSGTELALLVGMLDRMKAWLAPEPKTPPAHPLSVVLSLPYDQRDAVEKRVAGARRTEEVFRDLISGAREVVKIFSPYVDPTFTGMAGEARVPIRVVTTLREGRMKSNPVLERCSMTRPLAVRYLHEKRGGSQMFQLHAKMILSDRRAAYVGSANFTDTSLRYNLELGMYVQDRAIVDELHRLFDYLFDFVAVPARG